MPDIVEFKMAISDRTDPQLEFNTRSGGVALNGNEQILSPLSERWRFRAVIPIYTAAQARSLRVIKSRLKGRFNLLRMRICDQYRITLKNVGAPNSMSVPHSDGSSFSDNSLYDAPPLLVPITEDALANAETIKIRASDMGGYMTAGVFISINDWLYQIDEWDADGSDYILSISPPLREAVSVDDEVNFDATCLWQLDSDGEGVLDLQIGRFGSAVLSLVEPVGR